MALPPADTDDLRTGAPLHDALLAFVPLVGVWQGSGVGIAPSSGDEFRYGQVVSFVHDGRPFLAYESRSWLLDDAGNLIRPAWRESGFWRPGAGQDDVEVVLASNTGQSLVFAGEAGDQRWDLATTSAVPTATAKLVDGERRLYAIRSADAIGSQASIEQLVYVTELAPAGRPYAPHLQAALSRVT